MGDVVNFEQLSRRAVAERTQCFETIPEAKLMDALPIAAAGLQELEQRLALWLR
jgi:hypothetical protein